MATRFKVKDVEDQARLILLDTYADEYRFEPLEMYRALVDGLERIRLMRPASRYVNGLIVEEAKLQQSSFYTGGLFVTLDEGGNETVATDELPDFATGQTDIDNFRAMYVNMERRWLPAAVYYVVHRMYLKDDPDTGNAQLAEKYLAMSNEALGG